MWYACACLQELHSDKRFNDMNGTKQLQSVGFLCCFKKILSFVFLKDYQASLYQQSMFSHQSSICSSAPLFIGLYCEEMCHFSLEGWIYSVGGTSAADIPVNSHALTLCTVWIWTLSPLLCLASVDPRGWKMKPTRKCQKLQCCEWLLVTDYNSQSPEDLKMPKFTTGIKLFTAWNRTLF